MLGHHSPHLVPQLSEPSASWEAIHLGLQLLFFWAVMRQDLELCSSLVKKHLDCYALAFEEVKHQLLPCLQAFGVATHPSCHASASLEVTCPGNRVFVALEVTHQVVLPVFLGATDLGCRAFAFGVEKHLQLPAAHQ